MEPHPRLHAHGPTLPCVLQKHPERVTELVLRGIFLLRKKEIQWCVQRDVWLGEFAQGHQTEPLCAWGVGWGGEGGGERAMGHTFG